MAIIPQEVFDAYNSFCDDFINENFGINCKLIYPPLKNNCENCILDSVSNKSSNIYNGTGPQSFTFGVCPWCGGNGFTEVVNEETIKMRAYFSRKDWVKIAAPVNIPDGSVQTIGFITDLPKIKMAQTAQFNTDLANYANWQYNLNGEPIPWGFKHNRYFIAYWSRD